MPDGEQCRQAGARDMPRIDGTELETGLNRYRASSLPYSGYL